MTKQESIKVTPPKQAETGLDLLRVPFPPHHISKLPKPTKAQTDALKENFKIGIRCQICGGWHHKDVVHLDYVGHAALTDRLLDCDPAWNWEPVTFDQAGQPLIDGNGGMWIKLTVCGVTRLGYGHSDGKKGGDAIKEVIGDALRNAAMRFGAALDLWHKGDLHGDDEPEPVAAPRRQEPRRDQQQDAFNVMAEFSAMIDATVFAIGNQQSVAALETYWRTLEPDVKADAKIIAAAKARKAELTTQDEIPYAGAK